MTVQDFAVSGTFTVPAGVSSLWLEAWGASGGAETVWNGGYAEGDFACVPGTVLTVTVEQSGSGESSVPTYMTTVATGWVVFTTSGWDDGIDGGPGDALWNATYLTGGSAAPGSWGGNAKARITYTASGGGPAPFVGWGVPR